ncbi:MAG: hypothetical protein LBK26_01450 [Rickettsiales bacterium]|jgi:hypothetical protein|nr:hypothetical protein [Rickettsiales bacterium]
MKIKYALYALCPMLCAAGAASGATYYNGGNYQQGQYQYNTAAARPYNAQQAPQYNAQSGQRYQVSPQQTSGYYTGTQYNNNMQARPGQQPQQSRPAQNNNGKSHKGFYASAGITHESAVWQFDMKSAGSSLHYDNVAWNVLDVNAGYGFDVGSDVGLKLDMGVKFGMQSSESTMVDDDISSGGSASNFYYDDLNNNGTYDQGDTLLGTLVDRALSIGKSDGGSMLGYNFGLGLTDKLQVGNMRITPSLGWRSLSYKLKTNNNNGLALEVLENSDNCVTAPNTDELQCGPAIMIQNGTNLQLVWNGQSTAGGTVNTGNTYFYSQSGTSHDYNVDWSGPYLAVDLDYFVNTYNAVNARVELGLPAYTATGNQPYRPDWAHPKSVEDSAGMGSAYHVGLGANWMTALSDSVQLAIGLTYDYYTISGADAKTYLNNGYYLNNYNALLNSFITAHPGASEADALADTGQIGTEMNGILALERACPGWVCKSKGEIDSFYRSIGIRVGINAQF